MGIRARGRDPLKRGGSKSITGGMSKIVGESREGGAVPSAAAAVG